MPTRNVVLTDHQQEVIETLVQSGRYQNASEVLREGLRLVEQREAEDAAKLAALRAAADAGWRDLEAGRYRDVAEDGLVDYVAELGRRAAGQLRRQG
ncbi:MAG TPA: type II toxin-antitoxin system ParD family antitoxin [Phenylobacterium sp.]|uniref:type II toxin-antitoxin system ParD family antitoxin n=1 Tax=Phenylobacterium sp. TaxID=1871053 RepID=UPI002B45C4DC|nr:type II toxin-antitoxin system ParD family antitoxin [Phenylobacterium sp.]HKR86890.1 type II toxin-antitoxin system ParD family antitoxin [Phenylobacterium sp.]